MNNISEKKIRAFIGILKNMKIPMKEAAAITASMDSEEMMDEAYYNLKAGDFKQTPKEAMKICCDVIRKYNQE